ncbi:hypothetical protein D9M73_107190 [compost metagenome]
MKRHDPLVDRQAIIGSTDVRIGFGRRGGHIDADAIACGLDSFGIALGRLDCPSDLARQIELIGGPETKVISNDAWQTFACLRRARETGVAAKRGANHACRSRFAYDRRSAF